MTVYRCLACGHYGPQWKRIGLSSVCSEECERTVRGGRRDRNQASAGDVKPATGRDVSPATECASAGTSAAAPRQTAATRSTTHLPPAIRARIVERDKRCRYCGTVENLHVHHIIYRSQGGGDEDTNLITLCLRHHDVVHSDKPLWQPVLQAYIETFYDTGRRSFLLAIKARLEHDVT